MLADRIAELERQEAIIARVWEEMRQLKQVIGVWMRDVASHRPSIEPVEARKRYAELQVEHWQCRNIDALRREIGQSELDARNLQGRIDGYDREIAALLASPQRTPNQVLLVQEEVNRIQHYRQNAQQTLESIGVPRELVA